MDEIRLDAAPLSSAIEVRADFEGRTELEAAIIAANEAGDSGKLRELQARYRKLAHASTSRASTYHGAVRSTSTRSDTIDVEHTVTGIACTWSAVSLAYTEGREQVYVRLKPTSFDRWLRTGRLHDVPAIWGHDDEAFTAFGHLDRAATDDDGLVVHLVLDATPAVDALLRGADDGTVAFSPRIMIASSHEIDGERINGLRVFEIDEASIGEISFTLAGDQVDPAAVVLEVAGRQARYRTEATLAKFRELFGFRPRSSSSPYLWQPRFVNGL